MNQSPTPAPIPVSKRIVSVDALRGFALAGVALVHMVEQYVAGPFPEGYMEGVNGLPDQILQGFLQIFITGKFFALFSILFGLSFSIQMDSAAGKGMNFSGRFLWRAALLMAIGLVHQMFYRGDILTIYAMLAPFLIPFYRIPSKWLLITAGIIFLGVPRLLVFVILGPQGIFAPHPMMETDNEYITQYFDTITNGSLLEVFQLNLTYGMQTKMDFQLSFFGRFYATFAYFLVGLWLGRTGVFRNLASYNKKIKDVLLWSVAALLISIVLVVVTFATATQPIDFSSWTFALGMNFMDWFNIAMTTIILCGFLMLYQRQKWERRLAFFAPYGRMALTNYFLQSVIGTAILFGWGLGQMGHLRSSYLLLLGIAVIVLQTLFSKLWLKRFRFGPLEWLWRCGTYLRWQRFLRTDSHQDHSTLPSQ